MNQDNYGGILLRPDVDFGQVRDGRRSNLFYYDVDLTVARSSAAGTALVLSVAGDSFFVDKNPAKVGPATVHFQDTTSGTTPAPVYCEPGFIAKVPFTQVLIENVAQPGMIFRFHYGVNIDFQPGASSSVNVNGSVSVIDGGSARTLANLAYSGVAVSALVAAQQARVQLYNPPGSGRNLIVSQIIVGSGSTNSIYVQGATAPLTTLLGNSPANKNIASSLPFAQLRADNIAASPSGNHLALLSVGGTGVSPYKFTEPIVINPGEGLTVWNSGANTDVYSTFEFLEIVQ